VPQYNGRHEMTSIWRCDNTKFWIRLQGVAIRSVNRLLDRTGPESGRLVRMALDPQGSSDVDVMTCAEWCWVDASGRLTKYLRRSGEAFHWAAQIAWDHIIDT